MEENIKQLDLRNLIKLNVNFIEFFGYFCPEYEKSVQKICYYVYASIFVGFIYISYILSEIANMIVVFGDMEKMTEASFLLLTHIVHSFKLYVFITRKSQVRNLINSINREEFKPRNVEQYKILLEDIETSRMITKTFLFMGFATCALWGIFPFLDQNDDDSIRLPLSGWFPFNTNKQAVFEFVYVYQTVGALINGLANISMDTFLSGTIMVISGQLSILNNSLQIMKQRFGEKPDKIETVKAEVTQSLIRNVIHYRNIIQ
ncbi:7tm 6 domain containing protein [Asbolus verrucosus]|uniref:7tm 6 domain containing protein n=1 Tax=Asbolus verrucosus TaxID=1661398 RepID=A0A482W3W8_ASBVE|nr:7tm 6 domain containing protein [Asbolus verrucosus]